MGILDNLENAWDVDFQFESKPMSTTDNMGRPTEDSSLAVKLFSETCCNECECITRHSTIHKKHVLKECVLV